MTDSQEPENVENAPEEYLPPAAEASENAMERPGFVSSFVGVIASPGDAMPRIAAAKSWNFLLLIVLLIAIGLGAFATIMARGDMEGLLRDQMRRSPRAAEMSDEQIETAIAMQQKFMPITYVTIPVATLVSYLFIGFVFWLAFLAVGGSATFVGCWRMTVWGQVPGFIKGILAIIIMFVRDPTNMDLKNPIATNVAAFMGHDALPAAAYALLSHLDLFTFWMLWLLTLGMAAEAKIKKGTAGAVVIGLWLIPVAIHTAWAALMG